ncbi:MAG: hypothetical protein IPK62_14510 [Bacteroidetes bacterium]|nr:hypothetical protein [Bacteroidota bacterium]
MKQKIYLLIFITFLALSTTGQSVSGLVFNDANNNALQDGAEVGYPYVTVNAYAPGAVSPTASASTDNNGVYSITGLVPATVYRIEFVPPIGYHDGGFGAATGHSSVQFAQTGASNVNYGLRYANECTVASNPRMVVGQCWNPGTPGSNTHVLKSWNYATRVAESQLTNFNYGTPYADGDLLFAANTGAPNGITFNSKNKQIYFTSMAGIPAVFPVPAVGHYGMYAADYSGAGNLFLSHKIMVDLATIGINTTPVNQISTFPDNSAGTAGLGQVAVSGDGNFIYGVNMNDASIFKLDITNVNYASLPVTAPTAANLTSFPIPAGIPNAIGGVFRPFALKLKGNILYIGGINDGSTSLNNANVEMVVLAMNLSTNLFTKVFSHNLSTFTAGITQNGYGYAGIFGKTQNYWRLEPSIYADFQPFFHSVEFDDQGALIIGITNRTLYTSTSAFQAGYFVRAARNNAGGYTLENNGISGSQTSAARGAGTGGAAGDGPGNSDSPNADGPGGKFFYEVMIHDYHANVFTGGLYVLPGSGELVAGVIDPIAFFEEGARYLRTNDGVTIAGKSTQSGKGGTLTGTEAVCDANPVEIGNRVWLDVNGNSIQDGDELGAPGVILELTESGNNVPIATAISNNDGNYIFSTKPGTNTPNEIYNLALVNGANYKVKITSLGANPLLTGYSLNSVSPLVDELPNTVNTGLSVRNSDAYIETSNPTVLLKLGAPGENNYTYDFGLKHCVADAGMDVTLNCTTTSATIGTPANLGDTYAWLPVTGLNDATMAQPTASPSTTTTYTLTVNGACTDEVLVTVDNALPTPTISGTAEVCNGSTTTITANGGVSYVWSNLATSASITVGAGSYTVTATSANTCTATTSIVVDNIQGTIGNYVWMDLNGNGINDEAVSDGLNGQVVELWKETFTGSNVYVLDQTTTTANNGGNPGYYQFVVCENANYKVKFPTSTSNLKITKQTITPATDLNSDASKADGFSPVFAIDKNGSGVAKDNMTIDAGYFEPAQLGNYVWNDLDKDGVQDGNEVGVAGITVTLCNSLNNTISSTITDAYGYYKFQPLNPDIYKVKFTLPANYQFTAKDAAGNDETDSDVDPGLGVTDNVVVVSGDSNMTVDAGIYFVQPSTAKVGNFVWYDLNKDGIQNVGETGISGVTVTLYNLAGDIVATTITDADGFYCFTDVIPGTYSVGFSTPPGLTISPNNGAVSNPSNSDANPLTGLTATFVVVAGDNIPYVDAGMYNISLDFPLLGGLGDRVWYDVNQNGLQDANESGVPGVTVTLYQADGATIISTTTTDGFGYYIFNALAAGQYVVGFSNLPASYVLTTQNVGADSTINSDANIGTGKTSVISLGAGQYNMTYDAGIYNTNPLNNNSIGDFVWNDLDKDGIQDAGEPGVPGVTVTLYDNLNNVISTTSTDGNGFYLFPDLPNGVFYVGFSNLPPGYIFSTAGQGTPATDSDPNVSTGLTTTVTLVGNTHITDLDAGINLGNTKIGKGSLGDLVWYDMNNNGLQDPGEAGVAGVTVTLYESDGVTVISTTTTNALGEYIFTGLDAGGYVVGFTNLPVGFTISAKDADAQGINGELNSDVNVGTQKTDVVTLGTGEDKLSVDMGLVPPVGSAALGDFVWFDLNNDGLQTLGEPGVQGIAVTLYNGAGTIISTSTTDANGEYHFVGLTPDSYYVEFSNLPAGYNYTSYNIDLAGINGSSNSDADPVTGLTQTVTLLAGDNNLNLDAGIVSVTVASVGDYVWFDTNQDGIQDGAESGVGGILVTLIDNLSNPVASTITKPDGSYIFTNVIPGTYTISFSNIPAGMVFTIQEVNPVSNTGSNANQETGITPSFTVLPGTHNPTIDAGLTNPILAGLGNYVWHDVNENGLQDAGEPGIAGVIVTLYESDGITVVATASTDGSGAYTFTNLPAGTFIVGFSDLPEGSTRTQIVGAINDALNSDLKVGGKTDPVTLAAGTYNPNIDAGIYFGIPLSAQQLVATVAVLDGKEVCDVNWFTTVESNTKNFAIERSTDGKNFSAVGNTLASGNTIGKTDYHFMDNISDISTVSLIYYRVKLYDIDNSYRYSNVITARPTNADDILVYPTLFSNSISIEYTAADQSSIDIIMTDAAGKTIIKKNYAVEKGFNRIKVDNLDGVAVGNYYLNILNQDFGEKYMIKIQKK